MTLENAFYTLGIIYMIVSLLIITGLIVAVFVIRNKVVSLETMVKEKLDILSYLPAGAGKVIGAIKDMKKGN